MVLMRVQLHSREVSLSTKWDTRKANLIADCLNYREGMEAEFASIRLIICNFRKKWFFFSSGNITKSVIWFEVFLVQPGSLAHAFGFPVNLMEKVSIKGMFLETIPWCYSNANNKVRKQNIYRGNISTSSQWKHWALHQKCGYLLLSC